MQLVEKADWEDDVKLGKRPARPAQLREANKRT